NTIVGRNAFKAEESFQSVTSETQRETVEINGRQITKKTKEITNCISMVLPGPHVFLLLIPLGRFTPEEAKSVKIIQETFGENSLMYTMVLFTRGDGLKNKTIEQCLGNPGSPLMNLIEACGKRYHVFNNNQTEDRTQVSDLLEKIDAMVKANGESFYSCKIFRQMEREKQEQQMKFLMERVEKLEEEKETMKMMTEEAKQNQDKERKRREDEDKKRWEREKQISEEQYQRLKSEMEEVIREKIRIERERREQLEEFEKILKEERNMREDQQKTFEEKLQLLEEHHEGKLKRRQLEMKEEWEQEKKEKICTETKETLKNINPPYFSMRK
uniref:AIG1-type G domain-containing protein n=1 Tax=Sinocyclocheilus anshuiensis TaxID=1608454 RepID=A0A671RQU5_9TELE